MATAASSLFDSNTGDPLNLIYDSSFAEPTPSPATPQTSPSPSDGSFVTDLSGLASSITPLLVGAGVVSPVSTIKTATGTTVTTAAPGTIFGLSSTTFFLLLGALIILGVVFFMLRKK